MHEVRNRIINRWPGPVTLTWRQFMVPQKCGCVRHFTETRDQISLNVIPNSFGTTPLWWSQNANAAKSQSASEELTTKCEVTVWR